MIALYLAAITAANLLAAHYGESIVVFNAFVFIGFDLVARDALHSRWHHNGLVWKMGLLIATGSVLSYLINQDAGRIALASFLAFAGAGVVDALVYWALRKFPWLVKSNGSNIPSAATDSLIFIPVGLGGFIWPLILGQFAAKVLGGFVWSLLFDRFRRPAEVPA